jgi:hypothetical protein
MINPMHRCGSEPEMPKLITIKHSDLIPEAVKLLKRSGKIWKCSNVFTELSSAAGEEPDAFGIKAGITSLVEVKVSRSDFLAGQKKLFRQFPEMGMGNYRFYLCTDGLIGIDEIPEKWGLAYWTGKKAKVIRQPKFQESCQRKEIAFFNSVLRRINADQLI